MTEQVLRTILAKQLGRTEDSIDLQARLVEDLGADSLDLLDIVMSIESSFNIAIEDHEYTSSNTVERVLALIESKIK
jgi:acyl carrier protein